MINFMESKNNTGVQFPDSNMTLMVVNDGQQTDS